MIDVQAKVFPVNVQELVEKQQNFVFLQFESPEPDGSRCFALDFAADGEHIWAEAVVGSAGVRVPIHRLRAQGDTGATSLITTIWHAADALREQFPELHITQEIGVAFDPADNKDPTHFGLYVKMR